MIPGASPRAETDQQDGPGIDRNTLPLPKVSDMFVSPQGKHRLFSFLIYYLRFWYCAEAIFRRFTTNENSGHCLHGFGGTTFDSLRQLRRQTTLDGINREKKARRKTVSGGERCCGV
jgi:hypothetical protein